MYTDERLEYNLKQPLHFLIVLGAFSTFTLLCLHCKKRKATLSFTEDVSLTTYDVVGIVSTNDRTVKCTSYLRKESISPADHTYTQPVLLENVNVKSSSVPTCSTSEISPNSDNSKGSKSNVRTTNAEDHTYANEVLLDEEIMADEIQRSRTDLVECTPDSSAVEIAVADEAEDVYEFRTRSTIVENSFNLSENSSLHEENEHLEDYTYANENLLNDLNEEVFNSNEAQPEDNSDNTSQQSDDSTQYDLITPRPRLSDFANQRASYYDGNYNKPHTYCNSSGNEAPEVVRRCASSIEKFRTSSSYDSEDIDSIYIGKQSSSSPSIKRCATADARCSTSSLYDIIETERKEENASNDDEPSNSTNLNKRRASADARIRDSAVYDTLDIENAYDQILEGSKSKDENMRKFKRRTSETLSKAYRWVKK